MFALALRRTKRSIFPILELLEPEPGRFQILRKGTGFFISTDGMFLTASHCIESTAQDPRFVYHRLQPVEGQAAFQPIGEVYRDDKRDIYVGRIQVAVPDFLVVSSDIVEIGTSVCCAGYAEFDAAANGYQPELIKPYFQPTAVLDYVKTVAVGNRTYDAVLLNDAILPGMSGGPVVDVHGNVVGLSASCTDPRVARLQNGEGEIQIRNGMAIRSDTIAEALSHAAQNATAKPT